MYIILSIMIFLMGIFLLLASISKPKEERTFTEEDVNLRIAVFLMSLILFAGAYALFRI